ncbi:hypothetical protein [Natronoarchaeum rubrum]|uniref:hypothetical protein n=1 Tax=Natronoarchaeum rubrum TaxID=755311 RepID=UPI002110F041|nr:hypothetical protein [Natronoarchaeum rubrum]
MDDRPTVLRREMLAALGASASLAGCSGTRNDSSQPTTSDDTDPDMTFDVKNENGAAALDINSLTKLLDGYGVVLSDGSGCEVTAGSGMDVAVANGAVLIDGSSASIASTTVTIPTADADHPRKDIVYIDSAGTPTVAEGVPGEARPRGETGRNTYHPEPPDLSATEAVPLAEVWVPAGASEITAGDISDRRVSSEVAFSEVSTEDLNNVRHIPKGASLSEINSELSTPGTVVFDADTDYFVSDRLEIGTSDITVVIEKGARIKVEDSASPTLHTDDQGTDHLFVLYSNGYDNVSVINRGIIDGNATNHPSPQNVVFFGGDNPRYIQESGELHDVNGGILFVDNRHAFSFGASSRSLDSNGATIIAEGVQSGQFIGTHGANGQETIDLNARCTDVVLEATTGQNLSQSVIDLNEAPRTVVEGVSAADDASVDQVLNISGDSGSRYTSRTALGNSNGVTATGLSGRVSGVGVRCVGGNPIQNLTIEGTVVSAGDNAVKMLPNVANQFDGLTLRGYYETEASTIAVNLGYDTQQVGANLDVDVYSAGAGIDITDWAAMSGRIRANNCSGTGVSIAENVANADNNTLYVAAVGNGGDGVDVTGSATRNVLFGIAQANTNSDLAIGSSPVDTVWWGRAGSLNYGGTRTLINGVGRNSGDPSSGGDWNGNGREGVKVYDTTNSTKYWYVNGSWV